MLQVAPTVTPHMPLWRLHCGGVAPGRPQYSVHMYSGTSLQWTPSNPATLGTCQSVLIRGVATLIQGSRLEGVHCIMVTVQWSVSVCNHYMVHCMKGLHCTGTCHCISRSLTQLYS